jgi:hypothetical protein
MTPARSTRGCLIASKTTLPGIGSLLRCTWYLPVWAVHAQRGQERNSPLRHAPAPTPHAIARRSMAIPSWFASHIPRYAVCSRPAVGRRRYDLTIGLCFLPDPTSSGGAGRAGAMSLEFDAISRTTLSALGFACDQARDFRPFRIRFETGRFAVRR